MHKINIMYKQFESSRFWLCRYVADYCFKYSTLNTTSPCRTSCVIFKQLWVCRRTITDAQIDLNVSVAVANKTANR